MGIFFDQDWFDARLKASGLTRAAIAHAAGMTADEVEMVFSDRRELEGHEVHAIARALDVDAAEIASRSGVSVPDPLVPARRLHDGPSLGGPPPVTREMIAGIHERLDRLERLVELVIQKLDRR